MRIIVTILVVSFLQGCMLVDAFLMTKYDPNEYNIITEIRAKSKLFLEDCANKDQAKLNANELALLTDKFEIYSQHIPRNENGYNAAKALNEMAQQLNNRYKAGQVSLTYCKVKYKHIKEESEKIQHVIGARPR